MPIALASSGFHGSCPIRPGTSQAAQMIKNNAVLIGVALPSKTIGRLSELESPVADLDGDSLLIGVLTKMWVAVA